MKRSIKIVILLLVIALIGVQGSADISEEVAFCITGCEEFHERIEEFFTKHIELLGQPVLIEGYLFVGDAPELERDRYYYVYHWQESCCDDGLMREGMEVVWLSDQETYPEPESYVRAIGLLRIYEDHGMQLIRLELQSIESIEDACA